MFSALNKTLAIGKDISEVFLASFFTLWRNIKYLLKFKIHFPNLFSYAAQFAQSVTLPIVIIACALGVVIGIQMGPEFLSRGVASKLGILTILSMSRELVPIMGAFMLTTQFGTALTAEIANMQITEQLDALKTMKISPIYYLSLPALISGVLLAPLVFWLAVLAGTFSTYLTINVIDYLAWSSYATSIVDDFELKDALICMVKSVIFTIEIVTIAVTIGLNIEEDSAKAVGEAATKTVISCFIIVILTDLLVTMAYL